jgi:ubiquinone/menaquinone biosynthesis C-methylase UbiE
VNLGKVIELGCGPYTNIRVIMQGRAWSKIVCSDPLSGRYLTLPCWLAMASKTKLVEVDNFPAERCPYQPGSFDLVIMNNVLDHVMDADECLTKAVGLVKTGGFLILGQDLSDAVDEKKYPHDVGHPIRLLLIDILPHLGGLFSETFEHVVNKILPRAEGRNPDAHYGTFIYAGRKK